MQYQGGKSRLARSIVNEISRREITNSVGVGSSNLREREREREIWEPFCGGGAVTYELAKAGFQVHASDNHEDLILMWQALKRGETEPFVDVTEEEFKALKTAPSSARRGFVRFGGSFGGNFNGGYGRHHRGDGDPHRQYVWQDSQRSLQKFRGVLAGVDFTLCEYSAIPDDVLVYADPPYAGVYAYQGRNFDHKAFWLWVRSRRGPTYVSELTGPEDIAVVWRKPHKSLAACNAPANQATSRIIEREERLYYMPAKQ